MASYPQFLRIIVDTLFPERCFSCRATGSLICATCLAYFPQAEAMSDDLYACFAYRQEAVRQALWALKFKNKKDVAHTFAPALRAHAIELLSEIRSFTPGETDPFLVIPIPLAAKRERERGYNQAKLLARELCIAADKDMFLLADNVLEKTRDTTSQVTVRTRRERLTNLRGCFTVREKATVRGKDIIIIDDIITTGATMAEAQRVLRRAGARHVIGLAIAH